MCVCRRTALASKPEPVFVKFILGQCMDAINCLEQEINPCFGHKNPQFLNRYKIKDPTESTIDLSVDLYATDFSEICPLHALTNNCNNSLPTLNYAQLICLFQ